MPFVAIRDISLYYERRGSGPPLLFISGTGGDLRRAPTAFDWPLADEFDVLGYDQRGLGQSTRRDVPCTMADYADDAAALLDALDWAHCAVIGVSFGGMVAQEFALRHPARVRRLVLCCASSGGAGGAAYPLHEIESLSPADHARTLLALQDTRRDAAWQAANPVETARLIDEACAARTFAATEPGRRTGARRQLEARSTHDTFARLPQLTMPILICGGRFDGISPPANLQAMHAQLPQSRLMLFDGGHRFYQQDPTAYPAIADFLRVV